MKCCLICLMVILTSSVLAVGQIDIAYSPYTITRPGSYIVVKDLTTPQYQNTITILTSNVTIDLNGHTLYGGGTVGFPPYTGNGIYSAGNTGNISVINGIIRDFNYCGIILNGYNSQVTKIRACANGYGISVSYNSIIWENTAFNNIVYGIYGTQGTVIKNNSCYNNGIGIEGAYGCLITGNSVNNNSSDGIQGNPGTSIIDNTCYTNGGSGVNGGDNIVHNTIRGNQVGINGGSTIRDNTIIGNITNGISLWSDSYIGGNLISYHQNTSSSDAGNAIIIYGSRNRIENNHIVANNTGINFWYNYPNWHSGNTFSGNTTDITGSIAEDSTSYPFLNHHF